jgi:hypothetical protein
VAFDYQFPFFLGFVVVHYPAAMDREGSGLSEKESAPLGSRLHSVLGDDFEIYSSGSDEEGFASEGDDHMWDVDVGGLLDGLLASSPTPTSGLTYDRAGDKPGGRDAQEEFQNSDEEEDSIEPILKALETSLTISTAGDQLRSYAVESEEQDHQDHYPLPSVAFTSSPTNTYAARANFESSGGGLSVSPYRPGRHQGVFRHGKAPREHFSAAPPAPVPGAYAPAPLLTTGAVQSWQKGERQGGARATAVARQREGPPSHSPFEFAAWVGKMLGGKGGRMSAANLGGMLASINPNMYREIKASFGTLVNLLRNFPALFCMEADPPYNHVRLVGDIGRFLASNTGQIGNSFLRQEEELRSKKDFSLSKKVRDMTEHEFQQTVFEAVQKILLELLKKKRPKKLKVSERATLTQGATEKGPAPPADLQMVSDAPFTAAQGDSAEYVAVVQVANVLKDRLGKFAMAKIKKKYKGLISLLERSDKFIVERIAKADRIRATTSGEALEQSRKAGGEAPPTRLETAGPMTEGNAAATDRNEKGNADEATRCLHIGNLPQSMGELELRKIFGIFGKVEHVRIVGASRRAKKGGGGGGAPSGKRVSRRFAFIQMEDINDAQCAKERLSRHHNMLRANLTYSRQLTKSQAIV